jgi:glycosyltransferase involved in cell wall biosynthesis
MRPVIATFHTTFLGYTETFIYEQLRRLSAVEARAFALSVQNEARFPFAGLVRRPRRGLWSWVPARIEKRLAPWLWSELRQCGAGLIHAHFGTSGVRALPYARSLRLPLVVSYYGFDVGFLLEPERHPDYAWYIHAAPRLFREAALHLALTEEMRGILLALGAPPERVVVHHNGADLSRIAPAERSPREGLRVLLCGREVEKKGFSYGLAALAEARPALYSLSVEFLGAGGPLRPALEAEAARLGLSDVLRFLPETSAVAEALERADVLLVPSVTAADGDREGLPTILLEAGAHRVPAIASRHAGIPEFVRHNETGLLCRERDVAGLAAALVALSRDPARRLRLGESARRLVERSFDLDALTRSLETRYLAILQGQGPTQRSPR